MDLLILKVKMIVWQWIR